MAATTTEAGSTRSRLVAVAAFACLSAGAVAIGSVGSAEAVKPKEIGRTSKHPAPSCPTPSGDPPAKKICQAFGEVTGFQVQARGEQDLMKVPADGKIVAWAVDTSVPSKAEENFFRNKLGNQGDSSAPSARIALLTHAHETKFRLRDQGPTQNLNGYLGRKQYFTLRHPIPVKKNWIVALTTQTWVTNFAHDYGKKDDKWRASRTKKRCEGRKNLIKRSRPHHDPGSTRGYGCTYSDARILYWAYFVKD